MDKTDGVAGAELQVQKQRTSVLALWNLRVNHSPMTLPSAGSALRSYTYLRIM